MAARLTAFLVCIIVSATLIAGLIVGAQSDRSGPVDLIIYNGKVYTGAAAAPQEALAVRGNRILRVGTNREIKRLRRKQTQIVDAHGATVLPGLNDASTDFVGRALALDGVDLVGAATLEEIGERIRNFAEANTAREWVLGHGWGPDILTYEISPRELLDQLVPDRPARLLSADGRTSWVNSRTLAIAGITRRTRDAFPEDVERDPGTGEPTGQLHGDAQQAVEASLPASTRDERMRAIRTAIAEAHRSGFTSIQHTGARAEDLELYDELRAEGALTVRVYAALESNLPLTDAEVARLDALQRRYPDDPLLKAGGVLIDVEPPERARGGARARSRARRLAPENDRALNPAVALVDGRRWQVLLAVSTEDEMKLALEGLAHTSRVNVAPARGRRHRLQFASHVAEDITPPARPDVVASVSVESPALWSLFDARARVALAISGARSDPLAALLASVSSLEAGRDPLIPVLDAATHGGAYASFDEQRKGRLAADMLADIVVLTADLLSLPPGDRVGVDVAMTIFDGKVVYTNEPGSGTTD